MGINSFLGAASLAAAAILGAAFTSALAGDQLSAAEVTDRTGSTSLAARPTPRPRPFGR